MGCFTVFVFCRISCWLFVLDCFFLIYSFIYFVHCLICFLSLIFLLLFLNIAFSLSLSLEMAVPEVDKKLLAELESMEFPTARATRALHFSGEAIDHIISLLYPSF